MLRVIPPISASLGQLTRVIPPIPASLRQLTRVSHLRSHPIKHTLLLETIQHRFSMFRMHRVVCTALRAQRVMIIHR